MSQGVCAACNRTIDAAAKLCPYCGANPATGERLDTQAILHEVFRPKETTTSQNVMEYARQRQGVVVTVSAILGFLVLAGLHAFVTRRNISDVSGAPAVPLSEVTDVANRPDEATPQTMPNLEFQYDGKPQTMRTFIVEPNATTPPEVIAAQQAEALAKAQAAAARNPVPPQAAPQRAPQRPIAPQPVRPTTSSR
jgi:hypothetical protein